MAKRRKDDADRSTEEIREEALGVIDSFLGQRLRWEALRYAVSTAMWCPSCERILDVRRAGTVEAGGKLSIGCRACLEPTLARIKERVGAEKYEAALKSGVLEVTLGWDPEMLQIAEEV